MLERKHVISTPERRHVRSSGPSVALLRASLPLRSRSPIPAFTMERNDRSRWPKCAGLNRRAENQAVGRAAHVFPVFEVVGAVGLEPTTFCSQSGRWGTPRKACPRVFDRLRHHPKVLPLHCTKLPRDAVEGAEAMVTASHPAPVLPDRLISLKDLADVTGMSMRWLHERTRRNEIPCYRLGRALRFDPVEVRRWLVQHRAGAGEER